MTNLLKYSLALQLAVTGVVVGQTNNPNDPNRTQGGAAVLPDDSRAKDTGWLGIGGADRKAPAGTVRASKLMGTEVYNREGKHLGEIKDVVLDQDHKKIGYAVLSYGGIAGLGDKLFPLPHNMLQYSAADSKAYVELDEQTLRNAPGFDQSKWPSEANADYYKKLDTYYNDKSRSTARPAGEKLGDAADHAADRMEDTAQQAGDKLDKAADRTGDAVRRTGDRMTDPNRPLDSAIRDRDNVSWNRRASSLVGANVETSNGDNLGEVKDLVLDWQGGTVRYAVLSYGGILGLGDKLFAVPVDAFTTQPDSSKLVLNVNKDQLKNAPGFDQKTWPNMADPTWSKQVSDFYHQNRVGSDLPQ